MQISPLMAFIPDLYERIFDPDYIPPEADLVDPALGFVTPTSDEELEAMLAEWEGAGDFDMGGIFETPDLGQIGQPGLQETWWSPDED